MAVARIPPPPAHNRPDLVSDLVKELQKRSDQRGPGIPDIVEQQLTYGNKLRVTVIWDRWKDVSQKERGPIILDAYLKAYDLQTMLQVTQALGVTPEEAERLNIVFPDQSPSPATKPKKKKKNA